MRRKTINKKAFVPITINKSNLIINAIGRPSATAQKIFNMALRYIEIDKKHTTDELKVLKDIEMRTNVDFSSGIVSCFNQSDFLRLIPGRNNSWADTRDYLFRRDGGLISEYTVSIPDEKGRYSTGITPLIIGAYYDEKARKLYIKFQDSAVMRRELTALQGNYTKLTLNIESRFKSAYTIRIYEILDSFMGLKAWKDKKKNQAIDNVYEFRIGTERLKWMLGAVYVKDNVDDEDMKSNLKKMQIHINNLVEQCTTDEDYDKILENYGEWLSDTLWTHFKTNVLERVIRELNANMEFTGKHYSYTPVKAGRRYKYIDFRIEDLKNIKEDAEIVDEVIIDADKENVIKNIRDILLKNKYYSQAITDSQCYILAEMAAFDYDRISKAYDATIEYALTQKTGISSSFGLLKSMIEAKAEPNKKVSYSSLLYSETESVEINVEQGKKIIRNAGYMSDNISDEDKLFLDKYKKYICLSFSIPISKSNEIDLVKVCNMLKKTDELAKSIYDDNGQYSMFLDE